MDYSRKKLSDRILTQCRRQFWNKHQRLNGMLSWGEITKMMRATEMHLSNICMNRLYQISDKQKHGCIAFTDFLATYFRYERKKTKNEKNQANQT